MERAEMYTDSAEEIVKSAQNVYLNPSNNLPTVI